LEWPAEGYIFGPICSHRDTGAALVLPYANAQAMNLHLEEISSQVTRGSHAVSSIEPDDGRQAAGPWQYQSALPAILFSRAEPGRERLAAPAPEVAIARIGDIICAFLRSEVCERLSDSFDEVFERSCGSLSQCCFELCKGLFDRV
jgi:hypothetical protein